MEFIERIAHEPVTLAPGDRAAESADNTHWLGASAEERASVTVDEVVAAFARTARAVLERGTGPATFYVWHDEQAGQLRCSVTSRTPTTLPFGGTYYPTDDLTGIVTDFLTDHSPGFIPWTDLTETDEGPADEDPAPPEPQYPPFPVWTTTTGRSGTTGHSGTTASASTSSR